MFTSRMQKLSRRLVLESLEVRLNLSGEALAAACAVDSESMSGTSAARATQAVNCFAYDLYENITRETGNVVTSPLSISTALAMTYAGAGGQTAEEMRDVLHFGSEPGIHHAFRELLGDLNRIGAQESTYELFLANSIWPRVGFPFHESFLQQVADDYNGNAEPLDFSDPGARDVINAWIEEQTEGKIEDMIQSLEPSTAMVLVNSIYFRSFWEHPFDPMWTTDRPFTLADGSRTRVPMMTQPNIWTARTTTIDDFEVLELPLEEGNASMVIMLPSEAGDVGQLAAEDLAAANAWLDSDPEPHPCGVNVTMPRFTATVSTKLKNVLSGMGMPSAFGDADFSGMTEAPVFLDRVDHKAFIEVNEQGTEAAAATVVVPILCFAQGTPVLTADGEKPIEEIVAGEYVLSRNEHDPNGPLRQRMVEETFSGYSHTLRIGIGNREIRATAEHPFFVQDRGWTPAGELKDGDLVATDLRSWKPIEWIEMSEDAEPVHNFRVAHDHTYFVGSRDWGFAVWTHNTYDGPNFDANRPFHYFIRDNVTGTILFLGRMSDPRSDTDLEITPVAAEAPQSTTPIPGDVNGDDLVDVNDFLILSRNFGTEQDAVFAEGDLNDDGRIDVRDFLVLSRNFGLTREAFEAVQTPLPDDGSL